jgi:hypothetical protein
VTAFRVFVCAGVLFLAVPLSRAEGPPRNGGDDWPTLHGDLTRSGFSPRFPRLPLTLVWRKELHRELTGPRCEPIVDGGRVYLGTYAGKVYAWDLESGEQRWTFQTGGPVGHSPPSTAACSTSPP